MTHLRLLTTVLTPSCNSEVRLQLQTEKVIMCYINLTRQRINPLISPNICRLHVYSSSTADSICFPLFPFCPRSMKHRLYTGKEREEKNKVKPGERERTRYFRMSSKKRRDDDDDDDDDDEGCLAALLAVSVSNNPSYFEGSNTHIVLQPRQQSSSSSSPCSPTDCLL